MSVNQMFYFIGLESEHETFFSLSHTIKLAFE